MAFRKLSTKFELTTLLVAMLPIISLPLIFFWTVETVLRGDRIKLFVEQATGNIARSIDATLDKFYDDFKLTATSVAHATHISVSESDVLNSAVKRRLSEVLPDREGVYDLLIVVDKDGKIRLCNSIDRFGNPIDVQQIIGQNIASFPEEQEAFEAARMRDLGKRDWYSSQLVKRIYDYRSGDISRRYNIALSTKIPDTDNVLIGIINWEAIQRLLDGVEGSMKQVGFNSGYAFMLKKDRDTTIGHKYRDPTKENNYGATLRRDKGLFGLYEAAYRGEPSFRYEYRGKKISGLARIEDPDFNWTVGVGINDEDIIRPIWRIGGYLTILAAIFAVLTVIVARVFSLGITRPLLELTETANRIASGNFSERVDVFTRDEIGQLAAAFNSMAESIEHRDRRLREQQQRLIEQERLKREIEIAREVQSQLFPQILPKLETLECAGICIPAQEVGGDYYDFITVGPHQLGIAIGDVSGKGISAALLMASLQASLRSQSAAAREQIGELITFISELLYNSTGSNKYVTFFYGLYDERTRELIYVNAGHNPPLLISSGNYGVRKEAMVSSVSASAGKTEEITRVEEQTRYSVRVLEVSGPVLGVMPEQSYKPQTVRLEPGDVLIAFTDGITEAFNGADEQFSDQRLIDLVVANRHLSAQSLQELILGEVMRFRSGAPQHDDMTLVVLKSV